MSNTLGFKDARLHIKLCLLVSTWFGSGYLPKMPGTWGTLFSLPFLFFIDHCSLSYGWHALLFLCLFFLGWYCVDQVEKTFQVHDPSQIVIDETLGVYVTWYVASLYIDSIVHSLLVSFLIFRVLDILKPWPIQYFDRSMKSSLSTILDDIFAGLMGALLIFSFYYLR